MTAKSKTDIKAFFQLNDKPTESQFIDFIDSYVDKAGPLGALETLASAGPTGIPVLTVGIPTVESYSNVRNSMAITVYTTALVQSAMEGIFTTTAAASAAAKVAINDAIATTAQATAALSNSVIMTPTVTKKAIEEFGGGAILGTPLTMNPYALSSTVVQAHGLGAEPDYVKVILECVTSEHSYSVGDRILISAAGANNSSSSSRCIDVETDATNITLRTGSATIEIYDHNSPSVGLVLTVARWKIILYPFLL